MKWNKENKRLVQAVIAIQNANEAKCFLRDLMTENEIIEFSKRLQTAELLINNTSYNEIEAVTGFSSTTVARVSKWLNNGMGGYKLIINKLHHHFSS